MTAEFDLDAAKLEYERLCRWRNAWLQLANSVARMRRLGGLQRTQEKVVNRANQCNHRIALLLRAIDTHAAAASKRTETPKAITAMSLDELRDFFRESSRDELLLAIQAKEIALVQRAA